MEVVRLLAEKKADLDAQNNYQGTRRDEERFEGRGWMWLSGIISDGETGKAGGEEYMSINGCIVCFT